jgi:hypothetical protein
MNRILFGIAGFIMALALVATAPGTAAADTYSLSILASDGTLSWSGGNLNAMNFSFSEIVGEDANGNATSTFTLPSGYVGNVSFSTSGGYTSMRTPLSGGSTGILNTTFTTGTITVTETKGAITTTLLTGTFDSDALVATSVWNKIASGEYKGDYNAVNGVIGGFSLASLDNVLTTFFNVSPAASGSIELDSWNVYHVTPLTSQNVLFGNANGMVTIETTPVPIPGALMLFAPGLFGLVGLRKRFFG